MSEVLKKHNIEFDKWYGVATRLYHTLDYVVSKPEGKIDVKDDFLSLAKRYSVKGREIIGPKEFMAYVTILGSHGLIEYSPGINAEEINSEFSGEENLVKESSFYRDIISKCPIESLAELFSPEVQLKLDDEGILKPKR